jgi:hypothetical protein
MLRFFSILKTGKFKNSSENKPFYLVRDILITEEIVSTNSVVSLHLHLYFKICHLLNI